MNWNFCPFCGHRVYQHSDVGCSHVETTGHVLNLTKKNGWTMQHPLAERMGDKLFDCPLHRELSTWDSTRFPPPGWYALVENDSGGWSYETTGKARTPCDCDVPYSVLMREGM